MDKISTSRLFRIVAKTLMFTFDVVYTPGPANKGADAVSRNPVSKEVNFLIALVDDIDKDIDNITDDIDENATPYIR